jgi:hypothetical protein
VSRWASWARFSILAGVSIEQLTGPPYQAALPGPKSLVKCIIGGSPDCIGATRPIDMSWSVEWELTPKDFSFRVESS